MAVAGATVAEVHPPGLGDESLIGTSVGGTPEREAIGPSP